MTSGLSDFQVPQFHVQELGIPRLLQVIDVFLVVNDQMSCGTFLVRSKYLSLGS